MYVRILLHWLFIIMDVNGSEIRGLQGRWKDHLLGALKFIIIPFWAFWAAARRFGFRSVGGGGVEHPCSFSRMSRKQRRAEALFFVNLIHHLFRNISQGLTPESCKVRSPGQVQWPHHIKTLQSRHDYHVWGKVIELSEYDKVITRVPSNVHFFRIS